MTLTIQQVVADAKLLVSKLTESTEKVEDLLLKSKELKKDIKAMSSFKEDSIIEGVTLECSDMFVGDNAQIKALERENKELRCAIIEQQNGLELIMSKYRKDISKLLLVTQSDYTSLPEAGSCSRTIEQACKINEMADKMKAASYAGVENTLKNDELYQQLLTENQGLKELVKISIQNGSINLTGDCKALLEQSVQTIRRKSSKPNN